MASIKDFTKSNRSFYKKIHSNNGEKIVLFLASKDVHMTSLTMKFSKCLADVMSRDLIVVPNITLPNKVKDIVNSFYPKKIISMLSVMYKVSLKNFLFTINLIFNLKDGKDVYKLKIDDVDIGKHLYDYLLAKYKISTIKKLNLKKKITAFIDIIYYLSSINLIEKNKECLIVLPDNAYRHGMIFEYAAKHEFNCFAGLSMTEFTIHKYDKKDSYKHHCRTPSLDVVNKILNNSSLYNKAEESFNSRINGEGLQHDVIRAFASNKIEPEKKDLMQIMNLKKDKPIILIAAHIFRDAPHAYPNNFFQDYEEWLAETCKELIRNNEVDFIIKEHPSSDLYDELGTIEGILDRLGCRDKLIPKNIKTNSLFKIADCLITCGGTAGMEFVYNNVPVLLSASPPYSKFGFTVNSDSLNQYKENIKNIHKIPKPSSKQRSTALALLYITNELMKVDNLENIIGSQRMFMGMDFNQDIFLQEMINDCKSGHGYKALKFQLQNFLVSKERNIINFKS